MRIRVGRRVLGAAKASLRLGLGHPLATPYKLLGLTAHRFVSYTRVLPTLLFAISSSSIDSLCDSCSACLLPTVHPSNALHIVGRIYTACTIRLSINEDLKLKKRKGRDRQQRKKLYTISWSRESYVSSASTITSTITAVFCQCRNTIRYTNLKRLISIK